MLDYPDFPIPAYLEVGEGDRFASVEEVLDDPKLAGEALEQLNGRDLDHHERKWLSRRLREAVL
jgi:hypothetical protein